MGPNARRGHKRVSDVSQHKGPSWAPGAGRTGVVTAQGPCLGGLRVQAGSGQHLSMSRGPVTMLGREEQRGARGTDTAAPRQAAGRHPRPQWACHPPLPQCMPKCFKRAHVLCQPIHTCDLALERCSWVRMKMCLRESLVTGANTGGSNGRATRRAAAAITTRLQALGGHVTEVEDTL